MRVLRVNVRSAWQMNQLPRDDSAGHHEHMYKRFGRDSNHPPFQERTAADGLIPTKAQRINVLDGFNAQSDLDRVTTAASQLNRSTVGDPEACVAAHL